MHRSFLRHSDMLVGLTSPSETLVQNRLRPSNFSPIENEDERDRNDGGCFEPKNSGSLAKSKACCTYYALPAAVGLPRYF